MPGAKDALFEKCPLCLGGAVSGQTGKSVTGRSFKMSTCLACGAVFVGIGQDRYRLQSCDPVRLSAARGTKWPRSGCADCPPAPECYLGRSLDKADWERVARGELPAGEVACLDQWARMDSGELPVLPPETSPVPIEAGEVLYHISTVYTCEQPLPSQPQDEGKLVVTNRRIVLLQENASLEIKLDEVDRVEEVFPGFMILTKGSKQPFCFFTLRGDPVFHVAKGALQRVRGEG